MAQEKSKQKLANLIQGYDVVIVAARALYDDADLKEWAVMQSLDAQNNQDQAKAKLKDVFSIDYSAADAKTKIVKEGSTVEVLANHMSGMKGSTAIVTSYSQPALLSDITMSDGMKMKAHKWLNNDEVKLK